MGNVQPIRDERTEPVNIGDRAIDNLQFIRETMERSRNFTAVPGYGGVLMGLTAIGAAIVGYSQTTIRGWLTVWLVEASLAFLIGLLAMWQKTRSGNGSMFSAPAKKLWMSALPPMLCAVFITAALWRYGLFQAMVPVWIICYGAAVVCGGAFSVRYVPVMGWLFIAVGAATVFLPPDYGNLMMGLSFGALHIVFGAIIGRRFGG
jgi:hypothetical protein